MDERNSETQPKRETAGSLMRDDFIIAPSDATVAETLERIRANPGYRHFYSVYVCEDEDNLIGMMDVKNLLRSNPDAKIESLAVRDVYKVPPELDQEEVAEIFSDHNLVELPVVDENDKVLGVISVDDIVDVLIQEHTEDVFKIQGLEHAPLAGKSLHDLTIWQHFRARMPWLILSLFGGLMAGAIIDVFQARVEALILALVIFIPFIMALGGNVGSQSATILVREITLESVGNAWGYFLKEIVLGLMIGGVIGAIVGTIAWIWMGSTTIGWIVGVASMGVSLAGVLIGTFIPWFFDRIGLDTALGSGPIVTTLKDITGLLIYFGIAILVIRFIT